MMRMDVKELAWKWRCKLTGQSQAALDDIMGSSTSSDAELAAKRTNTRNTTSKAAASPVPDPDAMGSSPTLKILYEGKGGNPTCPNWVDYPPRQLSKKAAKAQDRVAIKVYKMKDEDKPVVSGVYALRYHMIDVQNLGLAQVLEEILKDKDDMRLDASETVRFMEPFAPLYFCYDDIVARYRGLEGDDLLRPHMQLLVKLLDDVFGEIRAKKRSLEAQGLINFKLAWTYFPRDTVVVGWQQGQEVLIKCESTSYRLGGFFVKGKTLRFDGDAFVWESNEMCISMFRGNLPITDLPYYPVQYAEDCVGIKARMLARGKKVLDFQGLHHCQYDGVALFDKGICMQKHNVTGRILIDKVGYNKHHLTSGKQSKNNPSIKKVTVAGTGSLRMTQAVGGAENHAQNVTSALPGMGNLRVPRGAAVPVESPTQNETNAIPTHLTAEEQRKNKEAMLANEADLVFLSPLVEGYSLKAKEWLSFFVDDISPVILNDSAFDHLVYDAQQKDLVLSFVDKHAPTRSPTQLEDVIIDKGAGLVVLLSGPPGTGKTLMAEAVADRARRPLLYLHAEDLGISAASLGTRLKEIMAMATEWNAVILLDECDVFLAERHPGDIARNELVSIFLRELEYFRGIIFLTTNLYSTIDAAFRSRVSLHLLFKPLTQEARCAIWRKFLDRLPPASAGRVKGIRDGEEDEDTVADVNDEDVKELAAWQLNGREIQNAVKMVNNWCRNKGYTVDLARLESGIKVTSPQASKSAAENGDDGPGLYDD